MVSWIRAGRVIAFVVSSMVVGPGVPPSIAAAQTARSAVGLGGWRSDLRFLVATIKRVHPQPFHRVLEAVFDRAVRSLDQRLPTLSDAQAVTGLMAIAALINDGHTVVEPGGKAISQDRW